MTIADSGDPALTVRGTNTTGDRRVVPELIPLASFGQDRSRRGPRRAKWRPKPRNGSGSGAGWQRRRCLPSGSAGRRVGPLTDGFPQIIPSSLVRRIEVRNLGAGRKCTQEGP